MFEYYCFDCGKYSYSAAEKEQLKEDICPYCSSYKVYYSPREVKRGIEGIVENGVDSREGNNN